MTRLLAALAAALLLTATGAAFAKQPRSAAAKQQFKHQQPCPATGQARGKCHGYVIDHIKPLACGGADAPGNMQWQTVSEAKAKDKWERRGC